MDWRLYNLRYNISMRQESSLCRPEKDTQFSFWLDVCTEIINGPIGPGKHYGYFDMCQCIYDRKTDSIIKPYKEYLRR